VLSVTGQKGGPDGTALGGKIKGKKSTRVRTRSGGGQSVVGLLVGVKKEGKRGAWEREGRGRSEVGGWFGWGGGGAYGSEKMGT